MVTYINIMYSQRMSTRTNAWSLIIIMYNYREHISVTYQQIV